MALSRSWQVPRSGSHDHLCLGLRQLSSLSQRWIVMDEAETSSSPKSPQFQCRRWQKPSPGLMANKEGERQNKYFELRGDPVWWLSPAHVLPCHLKKFSVSFLLTASPWRSDKFKRHHEQRSFRTLWIDMRCVRWLSVRARCGEEESLTLSETQQHRHLHLQGVMIGLHYCMSSITVNDKNRPLETWYLTVYPVTAANSRTVSNCRSGFTLTATRTVNNPNLTHKTPQEARSELCTKLCLCAVFSTEQMTLCRDRMLLQYLALQKEFILLEHKLKQMLMIEKWWSTGRTLVGKDIPCGFEPFLTMNGWFIFQVWVLVLLKWLHVRKLKASRGTHKCSYQEYL